MWRHIASNAMTLFVLILFMVGGVILWGRGQYVTAGPLDAAICLKVDRGSNMRRVSSDLEEQGAISSGSIFRIGSDYSEKSTLLKAGSFLIEPESSMAEIVDVVTRGGASTCGTEVVYRIGVTRLRTQVRELDPETNRFVEKAEFDVGEGDAPALYTQVRGQSDTRYRIALAEGVTSWQVVESLKALDVLDGEAGDLPAEGALAPDSYEISVGDERADVLARMADAQVDRISEIWAARNPEVPLESPEQLLTLASIVEKETGVPEERGTVASVFVNRLNQGMRLQTDPTVIYGITRGQGTLGRGLRRSELRRETPWNTYVIEGLPPTPIANPGLASLEAAANPPQSPYIFFVADGTGGHAFAETLREHNANVAKWRAIEAERRNQDN
ncbi:MAG: endolytic transglycosylase MltG [Pseudomonadota bacterium]